MRRLTAPVRFLPLFAIAAVATLLAAPRGGAAAEPEWPQFRGPGALGGPGDNPDLPETWGETENIAWRTDIPGLGWSSPIVAGNRVFFTSVVAEGEIAAPRKGLYFGGEQAKPPAVKHKWITYCLDLDTGKIRWEKVAHEGLPQTTHHVKNTYASETPVTDGERVYSYFGNVGLFVYDLDGKEIWSKKFDSVRTRFGWGTAASPALYKDRVYIINDNDTSSWLAAFDKKTGKPVWRVDRHDEKSNWATPYIWENEKRTEIITPGTMAVRSYDLDGNLLWSFKGMSTIVIATPYSKFGLLYVTSGYVGDEVRPIYVIRPGASGDISLKEGEKSNEFIAWYQRQAGPYNPTTIIYGDNLYVLYDMGFLGCYNAKTGEPVYKKERIDSGAKFTSSPWAYNGKIFCASEDGDVYVIQAGPEFRVLSKISMGEMCMATPAIVKGGLVLRTQERVYRIVKGAKLKIEEKKPEEKKADDKKPEGKADDAKKADEPKGEEKKPLAP